jgi:glucan phosphorylase
MNNENKEQQKEANLKSKMNESKETLLTPNQISTVHVDKAMTAIDNSTQTATISLFTMHVIPELKERFDVANYSYELVGELKIPFNAMDALAVYYLINRTSDKQGLLNLIQRHLREHPPDLNSDFISYGPTAVE